MTTGLITCTAFPVGANLFARQRTSGHLQRDDKHPSPNPRGLTLQRPSHHPNGRIAPGQANKFAPTKAAWPSGESIGRKGRRVDDASPIHRGAPTIRSQPERFVENASRFFTGWLSTLRARVQP